MVPKSYAQGRILSTAPGIGAYALVCIVFTLRSFLLHIPVLLQLIPGGAP